MTMVKKRTKSIYSPPKSKRLGVRDKIKGGNFLDKLYKCDARGDGLTGNKDFLRPVVLITKSSF